MSEYLDELTKYLQLGCRLDLKDYALTHVLGLTGSEEGLQIVIACKPVLYNLLTLLDDPNASISKQSCLTLVNISAHADGARALMTLPIATLHTNPLQTPPQPIASTLTRCILSPTCHFADAACMTLSNLSRDPDLLHPLVTSTIDVFPSLMNAFTRTSYNQCGATLDYLGPIFGNLSQSPIIRSILTNPQNAFMQRLVSFTEYTASSTRRGGAIATIRNCCFDTNHHDFLLGDAVDVLPRLLLPLADGIQFDDEDNDRLPPELQYLPFDKQREPDADIRCMLLEALTQLCALRRSRQLMRDKNIYVVLRNLHTNESDPKAKRACENLVDILIRTEDEIAEDNLKDVQVPQHLLSSINL